MYYNNQTNNKSIICFFSSTLVRICISSPRTVLEGHPKKNPTVCQEGANPVGCYQTVGILENIWGKKYALCKLWELWPVIQVMQVIQVAQVVQVIQVIQVVQVIQAMKVSIHVSAYTSQVGTNYLCFLLSGKQEARRAQDQNFIVLDVFW